MAEDRAEEVIPLERAGSLRQRIEDRFAQDPKEPRRDGSNEGPNLHDQFGDDRAGVFRRLASRLRVDWMKLHRLLGMVPGDAPEGRNAALDEQPYVFAEGNETVAKWLAAQAKAAGAPPVRVAAFAHFAVGEGVEAPVPAPAQ